MTEQTDPAEVAAKLDEALSQPQSMSADGVSVTNRSADDIIKADRYVRELQAAANGRLGVRFFKTKPPGAV